MNKKRSNFKILQITKNKFPPEIRVLKEGRSLFNAGYVSAVICPPFGNQPEYEELEGIKIFRPKVLKNRSFIDKIFEFIFLYSPSWQKATKEIVKTFQPNVLHIHDIWLGNSAFAAKKNQKVVLDLHENMPGAVVEFQKGYNFSKRFIFGIFQSYYRTFKLEKKLIRKADLVFVVVQEAKKRVEYDHIDIDSEKIINIENLESLDFTKNSSGKSVIYYKNGFSITYIGGMTPERGLETVIKAMKIIKENKLNINLNLIGADNSKYVKYLKSCVNKLNLNKTINFHDWIKFVNVLPTIKSSDLCIVPHHSNPHTDNTIPHKLYQYMISKKAVLVSTSGPLRRVVNKSKSGLIFKAGDPFDCAEKIIYAYKNPKELLKMGINGFDYLVFKKNNWEEVSSKNLIKAYDNLLIK